MAQQQKLPGVGPKSIPEIEGKARELRKVRSQRQDLAKSEEALQAELLDLLKKHGFRKGKPYQFEDDDGNEQIKLDAIIEQKEARAYVRRHKDPKDEEEAEETESSD